MKNWSEWAIYGPNFKPEASLIKGIRDKTLVTSRLCAISEVKGLRGQKVRYPSVSQDYFLGSEQRHTSSLPSQYFLACCQSDAWDGGSSNILSRR